MWMEEIVLTKDKKACCTTPKSHIPDLFSSESIALTNNWLWIRLYETTEMGSISNRTEVFSKGGKVTSLSMSSTLRIVG